MYPAARASRPYGPDGPVEDAEADAWLVEKARAGDLGAYELLVRRHRERIFRIALRMLGDHADADDVTQEVVIQLWSALAGFAGGSSFTTWLYRVVVNRSIDHRRRRRPTEELTDAVHPRAADAEAHALAGEQVRAGLAAIAALPEDQRVALVLVQLEGLSYDEAAVITKVSEAAVRGRLARARATLLREMKGWS